MDLASIAASVLAAGALGTAAYGIVDASKAVAGGLSNPGFGYIRDRVVALVPAGATALGQEEVARTLRANWLNGMPKAEQKAVAKALIRLNLYAGGAPTLAAALGLDATLLQQVATKVEKGQALTPEETGFLGRFDAVVSARLDAAYERADQLYRNVAKAAAAVIAVVIAVAFRHLADIDVWQALLVGIAATPLAPIAKDLSTALTQAATALRGVRT